ncbi:tRNA preQ1(34) S-adenosylmethionine ribosyltransferase-isomerase QueA [candidate division KSB3 bacterium]|uniref:S-adenosylmethionine:tRNA ribosyltransferase-isomerase n=1 Tax=candidate division KSB3 bacterium TaxID=2044937 RepID=A0A2G6E4Z7_9BACT|nr:MAG: tRNA preQ1(34) S-adenosylmethionine ribosyltransferase-isomerase QueA [candidate division KSB3 bacterium]PIE29472.1 MAG: tRNA preQ1(34) S-adenosylmethionine ribosyltransferase-isomerase QueA [candidate division KSB3 bacterium]
MRVAEFDYQLPAELIAQFPAKSREESRLMLVQRREKRVGHYRFAEIADVFEAGDLLLINDTKVIPARLYGRKKGSGGRVEVFLLQELNAAEWEVMLGGKVKVGAVLEFADGRISCEILEKNELGRGLVRFEAVGNLKERLFEIGTVPLPPYIKRAGGILPEDQARYQTVYARHEGAVAAPTAGLHFSEGLLERLWKKGVAIVPLTLHVGIGTFQPVKVEDLRQHRMMPERYALSEKSAETIRQALQHGQRVFAVGTTSTRLIESVYAKYAGIQAGCGWADIFIYPGFRFQVIQGLITNFHLPRSSLLMLVTAFGGMELIRKAYQEAIERQYRFYSYGDAMLII